MVLALPVREGAPPPGRHRRTETAQQGGAVQNVAELARPTTGVRSWEHVPMSARQSRHGTADCTSCLENGLQVAANDGQLDDQLFDGPNPGCNLILVVLHMSHYFSGYIEAARRT